MIKLLWNFNAKILRLGLFHKTEEVDLKKVYMHLLLAMRV